MTYKNAKSLGEACGLAEPHEFVNNVIIHATSLFAYEKIAEEKNELIKEARIIGVNFAKCGHAHPEPDAELCYICKKLSLLYSRGGFDSENPLEE